MIAKAIDRILELYGPRIVTIRNQTYSSDRLIPIKDSLPSPITTRSLSGIVDYLNNKIDSEIINRKIFIHIESPEVVKLMMELSLQDNGFITRETLIVANYSGRPFSFGSFMKLDEFVVNVQTLFDASTDKHILLKFAGNVCGSQIMTHADDGVTQVVTAKVSTTSVEDVTVPNPVELKPFRTFIEADQPMCKCVFRMKNTKGDIPMAAIFEADGGLWRSDAVRNIREYFYQNTDIPVIA